jgi:AcrR family transcriptional regulator
MIEFIENITIKISSEIYLKNPKTSVLGQKIIIGSIELMSELGYEEFTFKKLSEHIHTTESSIYRYFENKHRLLLYLTNWFWLWQEYKIIQSALKEQTKESKIITAIHILCSNEFDNELVDGIDVVNLNKIVKSDLTKHYFKGYDTEKNQELYHGYYSICRRFAFLINNLVPNYKYPIALSSNLIEMIFFQRFLQRNIKDLTDLEEEETEQYFVQTIFNILGI